MKQFVSRLFFFVVLFVSACGGPPAAAQVEIPDAPTTSPVEDPCSPQNLPFTVQPINDLMREFEDASQLASNLPAQQLPQLIADLQRIRRGAEDVQIPDCLTTLKTHQLSHMNLMIQTLLALVGGATQEELTSGLETAREEHDLYSLEIIRLLGVTLAPITATPPSSQETPAVSTTP
ncbi:MAG TPA: hypothetical protein VFH34_15105 [Anaerolineales bacterium]|nr:hypothetical protein [Anaerolineales bacterium]